MPELQKPASINPPTKAVPAVPGAANKTPDPTALDGNQPPPAKGLPWKIILIVGGLVFFVLAMAAVAIFQPRGSSSGPRTLVPTPTTVPRPSVPEFSQGEPSIYANDPQILQLEGALKTYERQLDTIDLREIDLDPPLLDMNVDFTLPKK